MQSDLNAGILSEECAQQPGKNVLRDGGRNTDGEIAGNRSLRRSELAFGLCGQFRHFLGIGE